MHWAKRLICKLREHFWSVPQWSWCVVLFTVGYKFVKHRAPVICSAHQARSVGKKQPVAAAAAAIRIARFRSKISVFSEKWRSSPAISELWKFSVQFAWAEVFKIRVNRFRKDWRLQTVSSSSVILFCVEQKISKWVVCCAHIAFVLALLGVSLPTLGEDRTAKQEWPKRLAEWSNFAHWL